MIRPLTTHDADALIKIRLDSLKLHPEAFGASYEDGVDQEQTRMSLSKKNEENFILGYFENDQLLGMVGFIREQSRKKRHKAWIWGMFVYPEHRGKGIGKQLLLACIQKAKKLHGLEKINLSVTHQARQAKMLYERVGFEVWGTEPKAFKIDEVCLDEIHMIKMI